MRERQREREDLSRGSRFPENLTCLGSWSSVVGAAKKLVVVEKRWSTIYLYPLLGCLRSFSCLLFLLHSVSMQRLNGQSNRRKNTYVCTIAAES